MKNETIDAEIVEDEFLAPVQVTARKLTNLVNVDDLIAKYEELSNTPLSTSVEDLGLIFADLESARKQFTNGRINLAKEAKTMRDPYFAFNKLVIKIEKEVQAKINPLENKLRALTDKVENEEKRKQQEIEEAEEMRIDTIKVRISAIKNLPLQHFNSNSESLTEALESLRTITLDEYEEFYDEAVEVQTNVINSLQLARSNAVAVENAKQLQDEEDAKLQADRDEFAKQQAEFQKEKDDFVRQQRYQQEELNRQQAEREANELMKRQEVERQQREQQKEENIALIKRELYKSIDENLYDDKDDVRIDFLVEAIIENKIPHLKLEV